MYCSRQRPAFHTQGRRGNGFIGEYPTIAYKQGILSPLTCRALELSKVVSNQLFHFILKSPVMVNFICEFDWITGCPDIWSNIIPDASMKMFLDEINI